MTEVIIDTELSPGAEIEEAVRAVCEKTLRTEGVDVPCQISVSFVGEEEIRQLNREHRGRDAVTDVLSFPLLEFDEDGDAVFDEYDYEEGAALLGDIVICLPRAGQQAAEYGHSLLREVSFLTAHSMLHLLGYDHVDDEEGERIMNEKQERILTELGITRD